MSTSIAARMDHLTESLPLKIAARAKKMIADGIEVVNLSVGEPDFASPKAVKEAGYEAIKSDFTRYTPSPGIPALREAIAASLKKDHDLDYQPSQVVVTNGAKQAIASTLMALVNPGDEVIYAYPCYASYVDLIHLAGGVPIGLETEAKYGFRVNPFALNRLITDKTKAIIINNPNNPTGAAFEPREVRELGKQLRKLDAWIIADEIYEKLRYDGESHLSLASVYGLYEKTALINGVSKYYAMTGWRIGFLAAPQELASAVAKVQSQVTGSPVSISQKAALEAYFGDSPEPEEMIEAFKKRSVLIYNLLKEIPDLSTHKPEGAFYAFPDVTEYMGKKTPEGKIISNSFDLCEYLLEKHHLAIIPGSAFGSDNFVRFSFAASEAEISNGVNRFRAGLESLS